MSPILILIPLALIETVVVILYMRKGALTQKKRVQLMAIVLSLIVLNVVIGILASVVLPRLLHV